TLFPYTTLFRSVQALEEQAGLGGQVAAGLRHVPHLADVVEVVAADADDDVRLARRQQRDLADGHLGAVGAALHGGQAAHLAALHHAPAHPVVAAVPD